MGRNGSVIHHRISDGNIRWLFSMDTSLFLKTKGLIRDLLPEPESRSHNGANSDILGRTFSTQCDEMPEGRRDSFNMPLLNSSFIIYRHIKCPSRHTSIIKPRRRNTYNLCVCIQGIF